jgi:hypothetical protein
VAEAAAVARDGVEALDLVGWVGPRRLARVATVFARAVVVVRRTWWGNRAISRSAPSAGHRWCARGNRWLSVYSPHSGQCALRKTLTLRVCGVSVSVPVDWALAKPDNR